MRTVLLVAALALPSPARADQPPPAPTADPPATTPPADPPAVPATPIHKPGLLVPRPTQGPFAVVTEPPPPNGSRTPAIIATAASGTLLLASVLAWRHAADAAGDAGGLVGGDRQARIEDSERWNHITIGVFASAIVSCGVTGYLWSRREHVPKMTIEPANQAVRVSFAF